PAVTTAAPRRTWVSPRPCGVARPTKPGNTPPPPGPLVRGSTASRTLTMRTDSPGDAHDSRTPASAGWEKGASASARATVSTPADKRVASPKRTSRTWWTRRRRLGAPPGFRRRCSTTRSPRRPWAIGVADRPAAGAATPTSTVGNTAPPAGPPPEGPEDGIRRPLPGVRGQHHEEVLGLDLRPGADHHLAAHP